MTSIDELFQDLRPSLRGVSPREFRSCLKGLEPSLQAQPQPRSQLTLQRLRFRGEKSGDFRFHPGVNVLRAGNDKGKSSILKLIYFCLTGKSDLKKDVDSWIDFVELGFTLDHIPHAITVSKKRRPTGQLVRSAPELDPLAPETALDPRTEVLLEWRSGKEMQDKLELFFNGAFGLRPLMGTQKDSRKGSDALLDSLTSYRAYVRGMYINQDLGYTSLLTDGVPYGNLFKKMLGMLIGMRGIDGFFAVEARRAHLENELGKEERYHRRMEQSLGLRDLATLDEEIDKLEKYIDELKVEKTSLFVRSTSGDLDERMGALTHRLVGLDNARQQAARRLRESELDMAETRGSIEELESALQHQESFAAIQPHRCPVCETAIRERTRHTEVEEGSCILCHEELPGQTPAEELAEVARQRLDEARSNLDQQVRQLATRRIELEEIELKIEQSGQQKRHLQAQLRSAHQATADMEREIELETRYLGRLEAERESSARLVSEDGENSNIERLMRRKQILDTVLRRLRTLHADSNERQKQDFSHRVREYCTTIGFPGLEEVRLDAQLKPQIRQNGKTYTFEELSPGEKVRFVLAFHLAMAIASGEDLEHGAHPGMLLIDSPGKEEMVQKDFEAVVDLLSLIEERHAASIQVLVATSIRAIRGATSPEKQHFIDNDEQPVFGG